MYSRSVSGSLRSMAPTAVMALEMLVMALGQN
jgi:hypothetical protein